MTLQSRIEIASYSHIGGREPDAATIEYFEILSISKMSLRQSLVWYTLEHSIMMAYDYSLTLRREEDDWRIYRSCGFYARRASSPAIVP
jgi:hypothetical protein